MENETVVARRTRGVEKMGCIYQRIHHNRQVIWTENTTYMNIYTNLIYKVTELNKTIMKEVYLVALLIQENNYKIP